MCGVSPPVHALGFPADPEVNPGLPPDLRGKFLWICGGFDCAPRAAARATAAAAAAADAEMLSDPAPPWAAPRLLLVRHYLTRRQRLEAAPAPKGPNP